MLSDALHRAGVWKAGDLRSKQGIPSGFPMLDSVLPWQGWPQDSLTEILFSQQGIGALRLLLPSLAAMSREDRWLIWVCPPHIPYVPTLQSYDIDLQRLLIIEPEDEIEANSDYKLWVFEQALRFPECGMAMVWLDDVNMISLRKLQLACELGKTCGVMFRPETLAKQSSPATLRLKIDTNPDALTSLNILKARGLTQQRNINIAL
ncbi:MAG: translesion DNA synthesis-associated protein ImuA [Pseudomonadota bacterium]